MIIIIALIIMHFCRTTYDIPVLMYLILQMHAHKIVPMPFRCQSGEVDWNVRLCWRSQITYFGLALNLLILMSQRISYLFGGCNDCMLLRKPRLRKNASDFIIFCRPALN